MRILILGPRLDQKGGVVTVQTTMMRKLSSSIDVRHIATHIDGSLLSRIAIAFTAVIKIVPALFTSDIVHVHSSSFGSAFRKAFFVILCTSLGKPTIVHTHGAMFAEFWNSLANPAKAFIRFAFTRAAAVIVLSQSWCDFYRDQVGINADRLLILRNTVDVPPVPALKLPSTIPTIVTCGRLGTRKGTWDLIRAVHHLHSKGTLCNVKLAGDGEIEAAHTLIQKLNLGDTVAVLGWICVRPSTPCT